MVIKLMATKIVATPTLQGQEALNVLQEINIKPDNKTYSVFNMLDEEFSIATKLIEKNQNNFSVL